MPMPAARRDDAMAEMLVDPSSFATTLTIALIDEFGTDALQWHPATVRLEVEGALRVTLPEGNFGRLMAGVALVTTDRFYKDLDAFTRLADVLCGGTIDPGTVTVPGAAEIAWAITEALILGPPEADDDEPFVAEVRAYIGAVLDREGILSPPDVLAIGSRAGGKDMLPRALAAHAADPAMVAAIQETERRRTRAITETIRSGIARLTTQVSALHLTTGGAVASLGQIRSRMKG